MGCPSRALRCRLGVVALVSILPVVVFAQEEEQQEKRGFSLTGVPLVDYNRSVGVKLGGIGMGFFPMSAADSVSPSSQVGLMGMYTGNKSWGGAAFARLFWSEDTYRVLGGFGFASINFQYYDDAVMPGGGFIDFNTGARFVYAEASRRVVSQFYAGVLTALTNVRTRFDIEGAPPDTARQWINGLGVPLQWDTRDNVYNATTGVYAVSRLIFNQEWLGSDYTYTSLNLSLNGYKSLSDKDVLAGRFDMFLGLGDVPFEGQRVVGRDDIRGYSKGEYRGEQVYAAQLEYRRNLVGRLGAVAFAGLALAVNPDDDDPTSPLLPGGGAGIRFMAIPEERINIGFDAAVGKNDWGIYFRITEAF
jgi:hypothetical protein